MAGTACCHRCAIRVGRVAVNSDIRVRAIISGNVHVVGLAAIDIPRDISSNVLRDIACDIVGHVSSHLIVVSHVGSDIISDPIDRYVIGGVVIGCIGHLSIRSRRVINCDAIIVGCISHSPVGRVVTIDRQSVVACIVGRRARNLSV